MTRLYIDTNIIIDLLAKRQPFYQSAADLFSIADQREVKLSVSSLTFANTNYILSKHKSRIQTKEILRKFKILVRVIKLDAKIVELALNDSDFSDFEDALQYFTALENKQDILITRNLKDFKNAKLPVMTAEEYLTSILKK
ncbi:MAG: PIN domain-containing protein [Bacteroidales bacterium]|nr:PIN domain-containing protein [Bacteroidales bacterium]